MPTDVETKRARLLAAIAAYEGLLAQLDQAMTAELEPRYERAQTALEALAEAEKRGEALAWVDAEPALLGLVGYAADVMNATRELLATGLGHAEALVSLAQALDPTIGTRASALLAERTARLPVQ